MMFYAPITRTRTENLKVNKQWLNLKATMKARAKYHRCHKTPAEKRFHAIMKGTSEIVKEQVVIGWFIIDYAIPDRNLLIEIDGSSHEHKTDKDATRDKVLINAGFNVLRITNKQTWNTDIVLNLIGQYPKGTQQTYIKAIANATKCKVVRL